MYTYNYLGRSLHFPKENPMRIKNFIWLTQPLKIVQIRSDFDRNFVLGIAITLRVLPSNFPTFVFFGSFFGFYAILNLSSIHFIIIIRFFKI